MRLALLTLFAGLCLISCDQESYLRLQATDAALEMMPNFTSAQSYRSPADTLQIRESYLENYFEQGNGVSSESGLGSFDKLELERTQLILASDSPVYKVEYLLETEYDANQTRRSRDILNVSLTEESIGKTALLQLVFGDTVNCLSADCAFTDTLVIDSVNYINVYYIAVDSTSPAIFINKNQGLVGFRTSNNKTYQRIK